MTGNYRFSLLKSSGWTRLGLAGAVAIIFVTPMLWSVGAFGTSEEGALQRAVVFGLAGVWLFMAAGYTVGWAVKGFTIRLKEEGEGEDHPIARRAPVPPAAATHPPSRPGARPDRQ